MLLLALCALKFKARFQLHSKLSKVGILCDCLLSRGSLAGNLAGDAVSGVVLGEEESNVRGFSGELPSTLMMPFKVFVLTSGRFSRENDN